MRTVVSQRSAQYVESGGRVVALAVGMLLGSGRISLTREGRLVFDVDVLVLTVPLNGFLQTFEALHEGRY